MHLLLLQQLRIVVEQWWAGQLDCAVHLDSCAYLSIFDCPLKAPHNSQQHLLHWSRHSFFFWSSFPNLKTENQIQLLRFLNKLRANVLLWIHSTRLILWTWKNHLWNSTVSFCFLSVSYLILSRRLSWLKAEVYMNEVLLYYYTTLCV